MFQVANDVGKPFCHSQQVTAKEALDTAFCQAAGTEMYTAFHVLSVSDDYVMIMKWQTITFGCLDNCIFYEHPFYL